MKGKILKGQHYVKVDGKTFPVNSVSYGEKETLNPRKIEIEDTLRGTQAIRLEGKTYHLLTAMKYLGRAFYRAQYQAVYEWKCTCGNYIMMYSKEVKEGRFKSCGCDKPAIEISHGGDRRSQMWRDFWKGRNKCN